MGSPRAKTLDDCSILLQDEQIHSCCVHWTYLCRRVVGADGGAEGVDRLETGAGHPNFTPRDEIGAGGPGTRRRA